MLENTLDKTLQGAKIHDCFVMRLMLVLWAKYALQIINNWVTYYISTCTLTDFFLPLSTSKVKKGSQSIYLFLSMVYSMDWHRCTRLWK